MRVERGVLPQDNFTIIDNDVIRMEKLSLKAMGLYVLLASNDADWTTTIERIAEHRELDGEYSVRGAVKELVDAGLVTRRREVHPDRTWTQVLTLGSIPRNAETADLGSPGTRLLDAKIAPLKKTKENTNTRVEELFEEPGQEAPLDRLVRSSQQAVEQHRAAFDDWYELYPRKVGKPGAIRAWKARIEKTHTEPNDVIAGLLWWRMKWAEDKTQTNFMPHPATWLNDERWKDALPAEIEDVEPDDDDDEGWVAYWEAHPDKFKAFFGG